MKTAKRVLAVIIAVIMIVGTCAVAASAAGTLQAKIDAAAAGDTVTLTANTTETVTINKDLTLDLNGYRLKSEYGKSAIRITAGNVTVTNGIVVSYFAQVTSEEMIKTVFDKSPCAIRISGGSLVCDGVRLVGGMTRVPTTSDYYIPTGSGIQSYNGATVTLKRTSIYGDYGVNNAVRENPAGGIVTVEDAIILAYTKAIKGDYAIADGSEKIIAADRIAGVLNSGIHMEAREQELIGKVLNNRALIVTKYPETITAINNAALNGDLDPEDDAYVDTTPTITVTPGNPTAEVVAPVLDYTWENTKGTDCSYKLVPEGVLMSDGMVVDLDKVDATLVNDDCQIKYRVEFKIGDEARPYILSLLEEGLDNPLDGALGWAGEFIDEYYNKFVNGTNGTNYVDTYADLINELGDLMWKIDNAGSTEIPGKGQLSDMPEFKTLRAKLYALAGVTAYNASADRKAADGYVDFDAVTYYNLFGTEMPADGIVGTLDRVDALRAQLEEKLHGSFKNTQYYGDVALWAYETVYPELFGDNNIFVDVIAKLTDLKNTLNSDPYDKIAEALDLSSALSLLDEGIANAQMIQEYVVKAKENSTFQNGIAMLERNKDEIKAYADKAVYMIENWRTYITPEKFLAENNTFVKTYSTIGPMKLIEEEATGKLHIIVSGRGTVAFSNGTVFDGETDEEYNVDFIDSFTVTATAEDDDCEFLFWANREGGGNRILSTEATFTMTTNASRDIEAVFNEKDNPTVYFVNPTGDICGSTNRFDQNGNAIIGSSVRDPYIAGYGFGGWAGTSEGLVIGSNLDKVANISNLTAYKAGNSAFADINVAYGQDGAVLLFNPSSSSYVVTPKYSTGGNYTITFYDDGEVYTINGKYSDLITMESNIDGAAYWVDHQTHQPVFVTKNVSYTVIDNASFESVAGTFGGNATTRTTVRVENGTNVAFYVERSTTHAIATTGVVYIVAPEAGFNPETDLILDGEGVGKGTAKFSTLDGLYAPSFRLAWLAGRTVYVRPFIEFADGTPTYYGDVVSY